MRIFNRKIDLDLDLHLGNKSLDVYITNEDVDCNYLNIEIYKRGDIYDISDKTVKVILEDEKGSFIRYINHDIAPDIQGNNTIGILLPNSDIPCVRRIAIKIDYAGTTLVSIPYSYKVVATLKGNADTPAHTLYEQEAIRCRD